MAISLGIYPIFRQTQIQGQPFGESEPRKIEEESANKIKRSDQQDEEIDLNTGVDHQEGEGDRKKEKTWEFNIKP